MRIGVDIFLNWSASAGGWGRFKPGVDEIARENIRTDSSDKYENVNSAYCRH